MQRQRWPHVENREHFVSALNRQADREHGRQRSEQSWLVPSAVVTVIESV